MPNTREKLIEVLETIPHPQRLYPDLYVDRLIANGVTIHTWIPVSERKPTKEDAKVIDGYIIAILKGRKPNLIKWYEVATYPQYFTKWMPIPKSPKGE